MRHKMSDDIPLLSPVTLVQLFMRGARAIGKGGEAMIFGLMRMASKDDKAKVFAGYEPDEHDVLVTCHSKSGTNWAMQIVVQTIHRGAAEFEHIHDLAAWPDVPHFPSISPLDDPGPWQRAPTKLRAIKTSLEAEYVPYDERARYLTVLRDPKEVLVSAYYFLTGVFGMRDHIDLDQWFEHVTKPEAFMRHWAGHTAGYWAWRERPNVLVMLYPEMKRDLPGTIDRVATLLGVELDEAQRAEVIRRSGFEYMKQREDAFAPPRMWILTGKARGQMMRAGKADGSKAALSEEQRARLDQMMLEDFAAIGSDFPYAELFMSS